MVQSHMMSTVNVGYACSVDACVAYIDLQLQEIGMQRKRMDGEHGALVNKFHSCNARAVT